MPRSNHVGIVGKDRNTKPDCRTSNDSVMKLGDVINRCGRCDDSEIYRNDKVVPTLGKPITQGSQSDRYTPSL